MNAVIYPRYSSTGQSNQTIETQIQKCKEYAEKNNLQVVKIFAGDKAKSASKETEKRKDLHNMLAAAETGTFQYIIVYELNRFMRNRAESVIFKSRLAKLGVKILSVNENIADDESGELYEMILEWRDEKYSRDLSRRVKDGMATSIDNGTYTGGRVILGYKLVDTGKIGKKATAIHTIGVDEKQAEIVRYIFDEYARGVDKQQIAADLNSKGCRLIGKPFKARDFDRLLCNAKYTGTFSYSGKAYENIFPQIIDIPTFRAVQKRLVNNKYLGGSKSTREPYLLAGKLFCGHCGTVVEQARVAKFIIATPAKR